MTKPINWYARRYIERFDFHLVPIEPNRKFPRTADWGNTAINDADQADAYYTSKPDWNMGVALGPSKMASLDIDCMQSFGFICDVFGIDLQELIANTPTIQGASKGLRLMFKLPDGVKLPYHKMNWRSKNDPTGDIHKRILSEARDATGERENRLRAIAKRYANFCVFELRACGDGKQRQDVLPPSIHPDTGKPYKWITQPTENWPTMPDWLLAIWQNWDKFKPQLAACCPWAVLPEIPENKIKPRQANYDSGQGVSVIQSWNDAHDISATLEHYGYRKQGKRYLSPHSSTGLAGVAILPDGARAWIHHASDPLCSDDSGHPVAPFDLFCYYEHGGDIRKACAKAADALGLPKLSTAASKPPKSQLNSAATPTAPARPAVNYMEPLPWVNGNAKPIAHIQNLAEILNRLGVTVRYNVIKKDEEILIPDQSFTVDNQANASLAWVQSECAAFGFPTAKVQDFITYIADQNPYNPVANWIESKPWDGVSRLQDFYDTIEAKNEFTDPDATKLKETLIKRWLISAVAAAYSHNGISAAGVLVLQGDQYLGKTKWFKTLVPSDMDLLKDGLLLRPDNKDSVKQVVSYWMVELGELDATFRKSDIAALKSFITKDSDELRLAYARKESHFARRTVFFGSVNPRQFLNDPTGNRRYWTIECESINHSHKIDMQQLWAEVLNVWKGGEGYYLLHDEMDLLNAHNESFTASDPVEERMLERLDFDAPQNMWSWRQATSVLLECGVDRPTRSDSMAASALLRKHNGGQTKRKNGKTLQLCPPVIRGV